MTTNTDLLAELEAAAAEYRRLTAQADEALKARDSLIRRASSADSIRQVDIVRATGLTRERIRNITK